MQHFPHESIQLLIATDVAARGIDVEGITHVINYELPDDMEVYTHRSGRAARADKKVALYFYLPPWGRLLKYVSSEKNDQCPDFIAF